MRAYRANGTFRISDRRWQEFSVEVAAESEQEAVETVLSSFGSHHRVNRRNIVVREVVPIEGGDITNPVTRHLVEGGR